MNLKFGATLVVALAFLASPSWAGVPSSNEIILKAQKLLIEKKRDQAIDVLLTAPQKPEITQAVKEVAERFLTDKGQRSYELGLSQLPKNLTLATKHLTDARELEGGNVLVETALIRVGLFQEKCKQTQESLEKLKSLAVAIPLIGELELQIRWCVEDDSPLNPDFKISPALVKTHLAWTLFKEKNYLEAETKAKEALALEPSNPATLYWLWRAQKEIGHGAQAAANSFLGRCRNYEAEIRRRSLSMIEMCLRLPEVEAYLSSVGKESGHVTK